MSKKHKRRYREIKRLLRRILEELDDVNGWLPTALQPGGVVYEEARKAVEKHANQDDAQ